MLHSYLEFSNKKLFVGTHNYGCSWPSSYCHGCFEIREIEESMVVCQGCRVARFCDENCQAWASKITNFRVGVKHKHICPLLHEWHQVVKVRIRYLSLAHACIHFLARVHAYSPFATRYITKKFMVRQNGSRI